MKLCIFNSAEEVLQCLSKNLASCMEKHDAPFHLALSGGSTARMMFEFWAEKCKGNIHWEQLRFYWVDERCVAPDDEESNFKYAEDLLFRPLGIPAEHICRIRGEERPAMEAEYYSELVRRSLPDFSGLPRFDGIILGMGEDGHTASIFPECPELLTDKRCYAVTRHPQTGQKRITMTGTLILNGKNIWMPVVGTRKTAVLQKAISTTWSGDWPVAYIISHAREVIVFTDSGIEF